MPACLRRDAGDRPARIRRILKDRDNQPMLPAEIKAEMSRRGWLDDDKLFYSSISTMTRRGQLLKIASGPYMLSRKGLEMD